MASISFPTTTGNMPDRTQIDSATKAVEVQAEQTAQTTTASAPQDTVRISDAAQARLLHQQGLSVSSIASALGTDSKTVDSYLGITTQVLGQAILAAASKPAAPAAATAAATATTAVAVKA
jgi:hypothetical protein